jgi:hypothetical protein
MSIPYTPPGVTTVTENVTSSIIPPGGSQTIPALVGEAQGYELFTESVLAASTPVALLKSGIVLNDDDDVISVIKTATYEAIRNTNYTLAQTSPSNGVIDGDEVTTIAKIAYSPAPTLTAVGSGDLSGQYRYALAWYFGDDNNGNPIESGLDESLVATITLDEEDVSISGIVGGTAPSTPSGTATGKVLYRSKNLGTALNPNWGPWYRIEEIDDLVTATTTDSTTDVVAATRRIAGPGLNPGDAIFVQYSFADVDYYEPTLFTNLNDVIAKYGNPFDSSGSVSSKLSLAANLAYANGASIVVCVALKPSYTLSDLNSALTKLEDERDVRVVAIADGSVDALTVLNAHVNLCNSRKRYRVGLAGRDGVAEAVSISTLRSNARTIENKAIQLYSPAIAKYRNSIGQVDVNIGGQYIAAAMAGFYAGRLPQETATRKSIAGLSGLGERRTDNAKDVDAQNGLAVVEDMNGILRIRHSISTDRTSINTQEFAVTVAQHNMLADVLSVIDNSIIGKVIADELASVKITSIIRSVLDRKVALGTIVSFAGLTANPVSGDPTTYNVTWNYKPTYTINNISITFAIDLSSGSISVTDLIGSTGLIL